MSLQMSSTAPVVSTPIRLALVLLLSTVLLASAVGADDPEPNAAFDVNAMGDMSDFDPAHPAVPTGDTIKIALVASFSGPAAAAGQAFWAAALWAVHDINKRGGLMVDGKRKLVELIKADHMSKPDVCKKVCERMALQEKVHVLWGTNGGHLMKIVNQTAEKYKIIAVNAVSMPDELQDATNFSRFAFQASAQTDQVGRAFAYYYGQVRKKERRFYVINQDVMYGHALAEAFRRGLRIYHPEAEIVGEDFHKLFLTDFAPYLTKVKASGAEVLFTGDGTPDGPNLLKQARRMGITLPIAHLALGEPTLLHDVGLEGTKGLLQLTQHSTTAPYFKTPEQIRYYRIWNDLWKSRWRTPPYNSRTYEHGLWTWTDPTYWLLSVIERAGSTDPEKIIAVWEGDSYRYLTGKIVRMRPCDHKVIQDLAVLEYVEPARQRESFNIPPYHWYDATSGPGPTVPIPARYILPLMDEKLERCRGKKPNLD